MRRFVLLLSLLLSAIVVGAQGVWVWLEFPVTTITPATPPSGSLYVYSKDDAGVPRLYYKSSNGTEYGPLAAAGGAAWGSITGTLSAQTDLQTALDGKEASGVFSGTGACAANTWASTLNDGSAPTCTQPGFSNLSGSATDGQIPDTITLSNLTQVTTRAISDTTGTLGVARGGTNLIASADDNLMVGNGTTWETKAVPSCSGATTDKLLYNISTNTFTCGVDQGGAGGGKSFFAGKSSASLTADTSCSPTGYDVCAAASAVNQIPLPFSGTFRNLYLVMATAPAAGSSCKLLVRSGACSTGALADTTLTCTVTGDGSLRTCSDTSNAPAGTAGQCVQLFYDETGTCTGQIMWAFEYTP